MIPLFTPGPVTVTERVLSAQARTPIYHRGHEYGEMVGQVSAMLGLVLGTTRDVYCVSGSGTATVEAALRNVCRPPDRVVVASNGYFGERLALQCQRLGLTVAHVRGSWTAPLAIADVAAALDESDAVAVIAVHHETSTGRVNDLSALAQLCHVRGVLSIIDAISSAGVVPVDMDGLGLDVVIATSQKGIGGTPGIGTFAVSDRAWSRVDALPPCDSLAGDWRKIRTSFCRSPREMQWTPPVTVMAGLHAALQEIATEQRIADVYQRRAANGRAVRAGLVAAGFVVWPSGIAPVAPVTVAEPPDGVDVNKLVDTIQEVCGATIAGGQGDLAGRVIRVTHLGIDMLHILGLLSAITVALASTGREASADVAVSAYRAYLGATS